MKHVKKVEPKSTAKKDVQAREALRANAQKALTGCPQL